MLRFWRIISAALFVWALLLELESRPAFGFVSETRSSQCVATSKLFASVLERIAGVDWEGTCRYVDKELATAPFELQGGIRFDFGQDDDVKLTSSVVFPNGQTRTIELSGERDDSSASLRLDSSNGPISMAIGEVDPDTLLINEVDKATENIVMTSSLSLVSAMHSAVTELIMVSHEIAAATSREDSDNCSVVTGHQIWRFHKKTEIEN